MLRFVDRHAADSLVIVPGWAFDHRIFAGLDLPYNYYIFDATSPSILVDEVKDLVFRIDRCSVSFLGWSKGAFAVCELAARNPELVDELLLISVRRRYDKEELDNMRESLRKNKTACLKRFYRQCFSKEEMERYQWFKTALLKDSLETISMERLMGDLDWLEQVEIRPQDLRGIADVKLIHGVRDAIAPIEHAAELAGALPQSQLIAFEQAGHMPFLRGDFKRRVYEH